MKFPQTEISNGILKAKIYLPDAKEGYYQGTRFDWSGNTPSLEYKGHNYFGQWFEEYSPEIHDVIMGPVEEFTALDYPETHAGENFVKIGVGVLTKPDEQPYAFARPYPVVDRGTWSVKEQPDQVLFTHELAYKKYGYHYEKVVQLIKDKPEMVLSHVIRNTGSKTIETSVYDHNFFVIDNQPVGPGYTVKFPFRISGEGTGIGELAELRDSSIVFLRNVINPETVFIAGLKGFGESHEDYDIRIENKKAGAGVRIRCDKPLLKINFWCCATTVCPEPYISIKVEPGQEFRWKISYEFYTL